MVYKLLSAHGEPGLLEHWAHCVEPHGLWRRPGVLRNAQKVALRRGAHWDDRAHQEPCGDFAGVHSCLLKCPAISCGPLAKFDGFSRLDFDAGNAVIATRGLLGKQSGRKCRGDRDTKQ